MNIQLSLETTVNSRSCTTRERHDSSSAQLSLDRRRHSPLNSTPALGYCTGILYDSLDTTLMPLSLDTRSTLVNVLYMYWCIRLRSLLLLLLICCDQVRSQIRLWLPRRLTLILTVTVLACMMYATCVCMTKSDSICKQPLLCVVSKTYVRLLCGWEGKKIHPGKRSESRFLTPFLTVSPSRG